MLSNTWHYSCNLSINLKFFKIKKVWKSTEKRREIICTLGENGKFLYLVINLQQTSYWMMNYWKFFFEIEYKVHMHAITSSTLNRWNYPGQKDRKDKRFERKQTWLSSFIDDIITFIENLRIYKLSSIAEYTVSNLSIKYISNTSNREN